MEKGNNSVMNLENFTKVNQVIYTLDTICDPNIMTLAQVVLEIFCSQSSIGSSSTFFVNADAYTLTYRLHTHLGLNINGSPY